MDLARDSTCRSTYSAKSRINFYECFKGFHIVPWLSDFIHPFQPQDHKKLCPYLRMTCYHYLSAA